MARREYGGAIKDKDAGKKNVVNAQEMVFASLRASLLRTRENVMDSQITAIDEV